MGTWWIDTYLDHLIAFNPLHAQRILLLLTKFFFGYLLLNLRVDSFASNALHTNDSECRHHYEKRYENADKGEKEVC